MFIASVDTSRTRRLRAIQHQSHIKGSTFPRTLFHRACVSMSSTASPLLPPGLVPLPLVQEELKWLLLETVYSAFLIPIAVVLFFFSTPQLRRRPIFLLNVCALALGIGQGIIGISNSVSLSFIDRQCLLHSNIHIHLG